MIWFVAGVQFKEADQPLRGVLPRNIPARFGSSELCGTSRTPTGRLAGRLTGRDHAVGGKRVDEPSLSSFGTDRSCAKE